MPFKISLAKQIEILGNAIEGYLYEYGTQQFYVASIQIISRDKAQLHIGINYQDALQALDILISNGVLEVRQNSIFVLSDDYETVNDFFDC